jgi:hypothetical protein
MSPLHQRMPHSYKNQTHKIISLIPGCSKPYANIYLYEKREKQSLRLNRTHDTQNERPNILNGRKQRLHLRPRDHATRTSQPEWQAAPVHICLRLNRVSLIRFPAARTAPILVNNPLVAEKTEPEPAQARQKARVRDIQFLIAYRTRGRRRHHTLRSPRSPSSAVMPVWIRQALLLRQIG